MPTFALNNENTINSYGFRVPNAGIDFSRFDANPVMLDSHINSLQTVLGSWKDRRVEGPELLMDTVFDSDDPNVKPIEGKVNRGFIKGASMGLIFCPEYMIKAPDGVWELTQTQLCEGTLCAVPSNAGALRLYAKTGELLTEDQVKLSISELSVTEILNPITPTMEKFKLNAACLAVLMSFGLTNNESEADVNTAIEKLSAAHLSEKNAKTLLQTRLDALLKLQATQLVEGAILEEKLTADLKESYIELAIGNLELATKLIGGMKGKASLSAIVNNSTASATDPKNIDEFEKLNQTAQLKFKAENPEGYKALFVK